MNIIPRIRKITCMGELQCIVPKGIRVDNKEFETWCLDSFLERTETQIDPASDFVLSIQKSDKLEKETYQMFVKRHEIIIYASTERGVIWALTSLYKLSCGERTVPVCKIADKPRYAHRGLMVDCCRHFFSVEEIKKIIEQISQAKINVFHWHLSDDQGYRIESKAFPKLQEKSGEFYTQEEIRDVVSYAKKRGVEVIPEIDLPGHTRAMLAAYKELGCFGKELSVPDKYGVFNEILCAGKEETFDFLKTLLDEVCPLFESERFHIGGDEAPKTEWELCPHCKKKREELGYDSFEDLQGYFAKRVAAILENNGKTPIAWNDSLISKVQPKDVTVQFWIPSLKEKLTAFAEDGGRWIYSNMGELYFDYPYSMNPVKKIYDLPLRLKKNGYTEQQAPIGFEAAVWTEHITDEKRLEEMIFPRIYAVAEMAWSGYGDYEIFEKRLKKEYERLMWEEIRTTPVTWWNPRGKARREEAIGYLMKMNEGISEEQKQNTTTGPALLAMVSVFLKNFFRPEDVPFLIKALKQQHPKNE